MTTKELLQYRSMCKELTEKSIEAKHRTLSGAVKGSDSEFPYTQHAMAISGMEENEQNRILLQRINKLSMKIKEIELFVGCIDDSLVQRIFEFRYIKGSSKPSWQRVAALVGGENTADGVRMMHIRYLEKQKGKD